MKINGKDYDAPVLNFGAMCELERWGLQIGDLSSRPLGFLAGYVGLAIGGDLAAGESAIDEHLKGGGNLEEISDVLNKAVDESGFFKATAGEKTPA